MARLLSIGFEFGSGFSENLTGTSTQIQSTVKRSGTYAWRLSGLASGTPQFWGGWVGAADANGPFFARVYVRFDTLPSGENRFVEWRNTAGTPIVWLTVDNTGTVKLYDEDGQLTGTATVSADASSWWRFDLQVDASGAGAADTVEARLHGTTFASSTTRNLSTGVRELRLGGNLASEAQTTGDWYFDDLGVNDSTGSFETSYPTPGGKIVIMRPNGDGDNAMGSRGGVDSGSDWGQVDDAAPNTTDYYILDANNDILDVALESSSAVGIGSSDLITLVQPGCYTRPATAASMTQNVRVKSASGATPATGAGQAHNDTTFKLYGIDATPRLPPLTSYTDPTTAVAWTPTGTNSLDNAQVGVQVTDANPDCWVSTLWLLVEYVPVQSLTLPTIASGATVLALSLAYAVTAPAIGSGIALHAPGLGGGDQSVTGATIASTAALTAPELAHVVALPTIASGAAATEPAVAYGMVLPAIASTAQADAPTVAPGPVTLEPPSIASGASLGAPTVSYAVEAPSIASTVSLAAPTVAPGPVTLSLPTIGSGAAVGAPTLAYQVDLATIGAGSVLFAPELIQVVSLPTIAAGSAVAAPSVAYQVELPTIASGSAPAAPAVAYAVDLPTIGSTAAAAAPSLAYVVNLPTTGSGSAVHAGSVAYAVDLPAIGSTAALYAMSVSTADVLGMPTIASAAVLSAPTLAYVVEMPAISAGSVASAPSVSFAVNLPAIGSTASLAAPSAAHVVEAPTVPSGAALYAVSVFPEQTLGLPAIAATAQAYAPALAYAVVAPSIGSSVSFGAPSVALTLLAAHIASTALLFAPTVTEGIFESGNGFVKWENRVGNVDDGRAGAIDPEDRQRYA